MHPHKMLNGTVQAPGTLDVFPSVQFGIIRRAAAPVARLILPVVPGLF